MTRFAERSFLPLPYLGELLHKPTVNVWLKLYQGTGQDFRIFIIASNSVNPFKREHEGKVAVISGSAKSIGAAIAQNLAAKGANVLINYVSEASDVPAKALAEELSAAHGIKAVPCRADISTKDGCDHLISICKSEFPANTKTGSLQVDILIHSAALFHTAPLEAVTVEDFQKVYAINVLGPILLTQACKPYLPTDRSGRIISLSSVGAKVGLQYLTLYGGTKGALEVMTRTWARELAENATVNSVSVGSTMTEMFREASDEVKAAIALFYPLTPLSAVREWDTEEAKAMGAKYGGRVAYPEEVAGIVGMLCSSESGWMTGNLVAANGGQWTSQ